MAEQDIYSLVNGKYLEDLYAVDNLFIRRVAALCFDSAKNLKIVNPVLKGKVNRRGEIAKRGVSAADKSVVDLCKLTALVGLGGARSILEEVAYYRYNMLNLNAGVDFLKKNMHLLLVDYLLASSMCYVEIHEGFSKVNKFFATRNRFIAGGLAGMSEMETRRYVNYLTPYVADFENKQLRLLRLNNTQKGWKVVQARSAVDFSKDVRIMPLFFMHMFLEGIGDIIAKNIIKFKYIKDNLAERELISTFSPEILLRYYDDTFVRRMMARVEAKLTRGYIVIPELGASKYDSTGTRALNVARITSMELCNDFDSRFIDVDFDIIMPTFKSTVESIRDVNVLNFISEVLTNETVNRDSIRSVLEVQNILNAFVDSKFAIGTTTFLRQLHLFMIQYPQIFKGYDGGRPKTYKGLDMGSFNLGFE